MKLDSGTIRPLRSTKIRQWRRIRNRLLLPAIAAITYTLLAPISLAAQQNKPSEYQVKAAYIYNFGKFVKWPAESAANQGTSFTICVLGDDPFGATLQSTLAGESLGGRPVAIKRIQKPQDATSCHILFLNAAEDSHLRGILADLGQASVLTVSDMPDFSKRGGMIQFVLQDNRVRFQINRTSAEAAGLTLASDLLKVAAAVTGTGRTGDR
jgi:hypothetical protein